MEQITFLKAHAPLSLIVYAVRKILSGNWHGQLKKFAFLINSNSKRAGRTAQWCGTNNLRGVGKCAGCLGRTASV